MSKNNFVGVLCLFDYFYLSLPGGYTHVRKCETECGMFGSKCEHPHESLSDCVLKFWHQRFHIISRVYTHLSLNPKKITLGHHSFIYITRISGRSASISSSVSLRSRVSLRSNDSLRSLCFVTNNL